jgi:hypothetical protein
MLVVRSGTTTDIYPARRDDLGTLNAKAVVYPSTFEYRLNGPESDPAEVNVTITVCAIY